MSSRDEPAARDAEVVEAGGVVLPPVEPQDPFVAHQPWRYTINCESGAPVEVTSSAPSVAALADLLDLAAAKGQRAYRFPEASVRLDRVESVQAGWLAEDEENGEDEGPEPGPEPEEPRRKPRWARERV